MSSNQASSNILQRKAIRASGHLGDFYDIRRDALVGECNLTSKAEPNKPFTPKVRCVCIKGDTNECRNLFRTIGVEDDLRVSMLSDLAPTVGLGAFLNHHREINAFTRILYYSYRANEKYLYEKAGSDVQSATLRKAGASATHVISKIEFGIDAFIVLQIPDDANMAQIDGLLAKFCEFLSTDHDGIFKDKPKDKNLLLQLEYTEVSIYSNMPALTKTKKLFEIHQRIAKIKVKSLQCPPIIYYFRPIKWLYPQYENIETPFHILPSDLTSELEKSLRELRDLNNNLERFFQDKQLKILIQHLGKRVSDARQQWINLKENCNKEIKRLGKLITNFRANKIGADEIRKALNGRTQIALENDMRALIPTVRKWKTKAHLINDLRKDQFDYHNVDEYSVAKNDNVKDLERKLMKDRQNVRILCSNDELNRSKPQQLDKQRSNLVKQRKKRSHLKLIYADFSDSSYKLSDTTHVVNSGSITPLLRRYSDRIVTYFSAPL